MAYASVIAGNRVIKVVPMKSIGRFGKKWREFKVKRSLIVFGSLTVSECCKAA